MSQRKFAVLIGSSEFPSSNGLLPSLPAAALNVTALGEVLRDPALGGFTNVEEILDLPHYESLVRLNQALHEAHRDDQVLIYYAGHGLLDDHAGLFLASANTTPELLQTTALAGSTLRALIRETQCRRIIVMLDCRFSPEVERADLEQAMGKGFGEVNRNMVGGYAVCVLAAAPDKTWTMSTEGPSLLTAALLEGIRSGDGDRNRDGIVSVEELHAFARERLQAARAQTPLLFAMGATGSLTISCADHRAVTADLVTRIREKIASTRRDVDDPPEVILERALRILDKSADDIKEQHEAVFSLLRDWTTNRLPLEDLKDQWYQFDDTNLVALDKGSEMVELTGQWDVMRECRRPIHDLVCPAYILDRNYHFLEWNPMFDELVAKPMGLTRFRHAEDFILKLRNHREIIERSQKLFSEDEFPYVDIEDLEYDSPKYGLIVFKKIAAQIPSEKGGILAWSVTLNITSAERPQEMWADLHARLRDEVNWSIYAKLYDRMLLEFDGYRELVAKMVNLLGDSRVVADLGAGTGNAVVEMLARQGDRDIWALEANEEMIEAMRGKLMNLRPDDRNRVTLFKGDLVTSLHDFPNDSMDGALMLNVLYALSDPARCLQEVYRVLKPGGTLVYSSSTDETDVDRLFDAIRDNLEKKDALQDLRPVVDLAYDRNRAMTAKILRDSRADLVGYARQAGFDVQESDVLPGEYEGAVTIIRAVKPRYLSDSLRPPLPAPARENGGKSRHPAPAPHAAPPTQHEPVPVADHAVPQIFVSYAREDARWCEQILRYLDPAERSGKIKIWSDVEIQAGQRWESEIESNLDRACVAVLLVTPSFLASEYVREKELPWILDKRHRNQMTVVPVMIELAQVDFADYKYPHPANGPEQLTLSELHFETYQGKPLSHLDKPEQNLFIDKLARSILEQTCH